MDDYDFYTEKMWRRMLPHVDRSVISRVVRLDPEQERMFERNKLWVEACETLGYQPNAEEWTEWVRISGLESDDDNGPGAA